MRIGMLLQAPFPPDIRVQMEASALAAARHDVFVLAYAGPGQPIEGQHGQAFVRRIAPPSALGPLRRRANKWLFVASFRDPRWLVETRRFARDFELDALHVHDLPLVGTALVVGRDLDRPVVADLHENYPAALQVWRHGRGGLERRLASLALRWKRYERRMVEGADRVVVVVDEARDRLIRELGAEPSRVHVVMNVPDVERLSTIDQSVPGDAWEPGLELVYVGGVAPHRGLETALAALQRLRGSDPPVRLRVVGAKPSAAATLRRRATVLAVADQLAVEAWLPFDQAMGRIRGADIGLVPHLKSPHTDSTVPHKLFQYMFFERPVVVSDCQPLERIVAGADCGLVFRAGDDERLAGAVRELIGEPALRQRLGRNGREAVLRRYRWDREQENLLAVYAALG